MIRRLRLIPATLVLSGVFFTSCASTPPPNGSQPNPHRPEAKHRRCRVHPIHPPSGRKTLRKSSTGSQLKSRPPASSRSTPRTTIPTNCWVGPMAAHRRLPSRTLGSRRLIPRARKRTPLTGRLDRGVSGRGHGEGPRRLHPGRPQEQWVGHRVRLLTRTCSGAGHG
jgi:hypothetical protein